MNLTDKIKNGNVLRAIVATDLTNGIGKDGDLLFHIKSDMKRFKKLTTGHQIIVGRKTLESFPSGLPLQNRTNLVLSHDESLSGKDMYVFHSVDDIIDYINENYENETIYVCGGESVYKEFFPYCKYIDMTKVFIDCDADRFFPLITHDEWIVSHHAAMRNSEEYWWQFHFIEFKRK